MGGLICRAALPYLWDSDLTRPLRPNIIFESFITISAPISKTKRVYSIN
jgi:hypothetical protein